MPTPETVLDNLLRTIGAAIYLVVLVSLVIFLVHETIMQIKWKIEEKKRDNKFCGGYAVSLIWEVPEWFVTREEISLPTKSTQFSVSR